MSTNPHVRAFLASRSATKSHSGTSGVLALRRRRTSSRPVKCIRQSWQTNPGTALNGRPIETRYSMKVSVKNSKTRRPPMESSEHSEGYWSELAWRLTSLTSEPTPCDSSSGGEGKEDKRASISCRSHGAQKAGY